jgi:hypothetical protein
MRAADDPFSSGTMLRHGFARTAIRKKAGRPLTGANHTD